MRTKVSRRHFLSTSAFTAIGLSLPLDAHAAVRKGQRISANDRIQVGVIGLGGRGRWLLHHEGMPGADVVAVADCSLERLEQNSKGIDGSEKWHRYQHYQEMLEKEKLDAVFVETTTHARVLACIHALQAGCDVYGEKPLTLAIAEGRTLV